MELLHKVSPLLLESESNLPFFVPKVVSIGPYHHGNERLAAMERFKIQSLTMFDDDARERVYGMAESVRNRYEIDPSEEMDPNEFAMMLFLDACFIVHFIQEEYLHGTVSLPQLIIDDTTKSKFLNLMALEMCPKGERGYGVTSYICLLDNLIDHADDVRELRFRGILVNCLGSDQQAADLFNELATNRTPYPDAYGDIITGIHKHLNNRCKVSLAIGYNKHFNTPWSMIATCAATLGLGLSAVQAWYSAK
ncbi:hypothetical protein QJS04_geneDACA024383 [Acorus gramineus]|uniref:Uncharacterized protein n=1 Tax=Acorus gramineus TaxID=55184 RepID=A0AAV8ZWW1_ACOGR|nr:hypothetical protein QJS04_geneDACA024383 [Acorus gramineus]